MMLYELNQSTTGSELNDIKECIFLYIERGEGC